MEAFPDTFTYKELIAHPPDAAAVPHMHTMRAHLAAVRVRVFQGILKAYNKSGSMAYSVNAAGLDTESKRVLVAELAARFPGRVYAVTCDGYDLMDGADDSFRTSNRYDIELSPDHIPRHHRSFSPDF